MGYRYSAQLLRTLRNDVDIRPLIANVLEWPSKLSEGYFRFLCPLCSEFNCAVNPDTNLGRCFRCQVNFNPIDFLMATGDFTFVEAVEFLQQMMKDPRIHPSRAATTQRPRPDAASSATESETEWLT
jgi:DNA primase